jgi:phosphoribosylamine--glycine ligase/phosphoribosylaminoimidazole synthetase
MIITIMNVLIIGSGGREHAICKKLSKSQCNLFYYGTHDNPKMSELASNIGIGYMQHVDDMIQSALKHNIDLVVVGPEVPLFFGLTDKLLKNNIAVIGPTKELAKIETSKHFARELMYNNGLGRYCPSILSVIEPGTSHDDIAVSIKTIMKSSKIVIKVDGICGGKGVVIQDDHFTSSEEAIDHCINFTNTDKVIIEEKLFGEEFSIMSFCDGSTLKHMIPVKDYKRLYDNDRGPNTGSMGSITGYDGKLWFLNDNDINICHKINEKVAQLLGSYSGILYGSFMKTNKKEIKVIEFNARLGDPESINILELLENDLLDIFCAIISKSLHKIDLRFNKSASVFKYKVPKSYPMYSSKEIIKLNPCDNMIYSSITKDKNGDYTTLGSRTLGVIVLSESLLDARSKANQTLSSIENTLFYRKDIGDLALSYKESGVNTEEKSIAIQEIEKYATSTYNNQVISSFGDFAGIMTFGDSALITSTDGVGTKSIMVLKHCGYEKGFEMLGHDLVNLNVNDILVKGANPLFFLDYFGCHKLNANHLKYFIKGITDACKNINCVLLKGETAQMPDIYYPETFDLVGTIVGHVNQTDIINGKVMIKEGDVVIGLPSTGPHTNGFSLIRKILDRVQTFEIVSDKIKNDLCMTHKCYYHDVKLLRESVTINGLCHITGGGLTENPPRILPEGLDIKYNDWELPDVFKYLQHKGQLDNNEMRRTFNCGIGMMVIIPKEDLNKVKNYQCIGEIIKSPIQ